MKMSESIANLAPAFAKAQAAIQHVVKDKTGKIQMKTGGSYEYKYSDLASVIEAVKGPLNSNQIAFIQSPSGDSTGVTVTTTFLHSSGEWFADTLYMPVGSGTPQAYGSAITYCKRYQLQSMSGLPSEDDDGAKASEKESPRQEPRQEPRPNTATQVAVDAFEALPTDQREWIREQALEVISLHSMKGDMVGFVHTLELDTEAKLALWSQLPSPVRTAYKKQDHEQRSLAEQA